MIEDGALVGFDRSCYVRRGESLIDDFGLMVFFSWSGLDIGLNYAPISNPAFTVHDGKVILELSYSICKGNEVFQSGSTIGSVLTHSLSRFPTSRFKAISKPFIVLLHF